MRTAAGASMPRFAAARPIPVAPPVITAVFSFSLVISCSLRWISVTIKVSILSKKKLSGPGPDFGHHVRQCRLPQLRTDGLLSAKQHVAHDFLDVAAHDARLRLGVGMDSKGIWGIYRGVDVQERNTLWASCQAITTRLTDSRRSQLRLREFNEDSLNENRVRIHAASENSRREGSLVMCDCRQYVHGDRELSVHGSHLWIL